jgi:hypothetical protein
LDDAINFIRNHLKDSAEDPLGYFYLLIKLHKQPISGCPICSDCGSLTHALGRWVDKTLQPIVKDQALYLKNSAALKEEPKCMEMPTSASLIAYDVGTMYPSINTAQCIARLSEYLSSPEISSKYGFSPKALLDALTLVMLNNQMWFGVIIVKQLSGIAMWMLPASMIANLFVAIYENNHGSRTPHKSCSTCAISLTMALVSGSMIQTHSLRRAVVSSGFLASG